MINFLLGAPGGGKSYEAVAYHVLPALNSGRKVVTNLPLLLDQFPPEQRGLIELRSQAKAQVDGRLAGRPFSSLACYGDTWLHPDLDVGPLYVIDECHLALPRGSTPVEIREWYSMHRHEKADVLLISQSHGKVDKDICDMVQNVYKVRKASAFGFQNHYIRKVFDGFRGDCVNTGQRKYEKRYFKFYRSHTKSAAASGVELAANDIIPLWKRWPFIGLAIVLVMLIALLSSGRDMNPMKPKIPAQKAPQSTGNALSSSAPGQGPSHPGGARTEEHAGRDGAAPGRSDQSRGHPFAGLGIHVTGYGRFKGHQAFYAVSFSQNGQRIFSSTSVELQEAGYKVTRISDCAMGLDYKGVEIVAVCDSPTASVAPGEGVTSDKVKGET